MSFEARREIREYSFRVQAQRADLFPLFCPKRELEWLEGWAYEMVYSSTGFSEQDCVFKTESAFDGPAIWIASQHQFPHMVEYIRVAPEALVLRMALYLTEQADETTQVRVKYTYTGLTEKGNECIEQYVTVHHPQKMEIFKRSLDQYFQKKG